MLSEKFVTVSRDSHVEFEEKRSVFIGHARRCDTEEAALEFVKSIKKEYKDATHNVWAYSINDGVLARYSDDGEPQGTAGMPVLDAIRKGGVNNVCVVVTRYFGGTLLGAGGLVRAYSHSAAIAIEGAEVVMYEPYDIFELKCGYSEYQKYNAYFMNIKALIEDTKFDADVTVTFAVKRTLSDEVLKKITEMSFGRDIPKLIGERYDYR